MTKRILLTTDFSKNAENAMNYAIALFKEDTCEFFILNSYEVGVFSMELAAVRELEESKQKSMAGLIKILDQLKGKNNRDNHLFQIVSEYGNLIDLMKGLIAYHDIDLVVMGTKGSTASSAKIYGSQTTLAMERIRNCPVLAVPDDAIYKGIKEIAFPTGYKTTYKRKEFQYLVDIAKKTGAAIRVLHVMDKKTKLTENQKHHQLLLKDYFEGLEYSFVTLYDIELQKAINSFIENHDIDMVVFINKKHNLFSWILSKPLVKKLTYHSSIPILALHDFKN
ncbi:universal stress protein [Winogradskyella sp.]|uniref:universal stress protein n=1 Tax=Winogradskyella sp. TaxID=1883156 RepID=UPI0025D9DBFF|nr:universal stress protein [Winogradskyella sp.]MBT8243657.1 universal stress protein [Winogradskyella sp.]